MIVTNDMLYATRGGDESVPRLFIPLIAFGIAFGYLEATVVVYLREIYYPAGFAFPILIVPIRLAWIELAREAATLVMLWAVACLAGRTRWERFGHFAFLFGVWDIAFYGGLYVTLGWPPSLLTWDLLFLIPLIWTGPVIAPVLISLFLIAAGARIANRERYGAGIHVTRTHWVLGAISLTLLLGSFLANHSVTYRGGIPGPFPWIPFTIGLMIGGYLGWKITVPKRTADPDYPLTK